MIIMKENNKSYNFIVKSYEDTENLTDSINSILRPLYNNILLYFDEEMLELVYRKIYFELSLKLDSAIDNGIKKEQFDYFVYEETLLLLNNVLQSNEIDCFGDNYLLSKCNFTFIEKKVIFLFLPYVILDCFDSKRKNMIKEIAMKRYNLTSLDFIKILFKFTTETVKATMRKEKKNTQLKK